MGGTLTLGQLVALTGGNPTIIDALPGSVSHASKQRLAWLRDAVEDAQDRRKGLPVKIRGGLVDEEL